MNLLVIVNLAIKCPKQCEKKSHNLQVTGFILASSFSWQTLHGGSSVEFLNGLTTTATTSGSPWLTVPLSKPQGWCSHCFFLQSGLLSHPDAPSGPQPCDDHWRCDANRKLLCCRAFIRSENTVKAYWRLSLIHVPDWRLCAFGKLPFIPPTKTAILSSQPFF